MSARLGWGIQEDKSGKTTGAAAHGGSSPGVSGMLYIVPKQRLAVAFLCNLENATGREPMAQAIGSIVAPAR